MWRKAVKAAEHVGSLCQRGRWKRRSYIAIGQSERSRCIKTLKDASRPYRCHYFANKKAWMNSDLVTDILTYFNWKIILFMDNAPCHPAGLQDRLSNINIVFLPKNTTSKTQPLDSGIIASWKCRYKKRLLRIVVKWMDQTVRATL